MTRSIVEEILVESLHDAGENPKGRCPMLCYLTWSSETGWHNECVLKCPDFAGGFPRVHHGGSQCSIAFGVRRPAIRVSLDVGIAVCFGNLILVACSAHDRY